MSGSSLKKAANAIIIIITSINFLTITSINFYPALGFSVLGHRSWAWRNGQKMGPSLTWLTQELLKNGMTLDHIYGSPTHHGDGPKNLLQIPFSQAMKPCHSTHHRPKGRWDQEFAVANCTQRCCVLVWIFPFPKGWLLLVEMNFCPFTHTLSPELSVVLASKTTSRTASSYKRSLLNASQWNQWRV